MYIITNENPRSFQCFACHAEDEVLFRVQSRSRGIEDGNEDLKPRLLCQHCLEQAAQACTPQFPISGATSVARKGPRKGYPFYVSFSRKPVRYTLTAWARYLMRHPMQAHRNVPPVNFVTVVGANGKVQASRF